MINESYYRNLPGKNILKESPEKNLSDKSFDSLDDIPLDNLIINSNLDNSNVIK